MQQRRQEGLWRREEGGGRREVVVPCSLLPRYRKVHSVTNSCGQVVVAAPIFNQAAAKTGPSFLPIPPFHSCDRLWVCLGSPE